MNSSEEVWKHAILRALVVSTSGIVVGFVLYQTFIFTPTMKPFQFTVSSITAGLAYAALKSPTIRNGLAALLVWYIVLTGLVEEFNSWLLILNAAYVAGITAAMYVYDRTVRKPFVRGVIQRIFVAGALTAIANGLIIVVLALFTFKVAASHAAIMLKEIYYNVQLGALIGLALGVGIELAEYLIGKLLLHESAIDHDNEAA